QGDLRSVREEYSIAVVSLAAIAERTVVEGDLVFQCLVSQVPRRLSAKVLELVFGSEAVLYLARVEIGRPVEVLKQHPLGTTTVSSDGFLEVERRCPRLRRQAWRVVLSRCSHCDHVEGMGERLCEIGCHGTCDRRVGVINFVPEGSEHCSCGEVEGIVPSDD